MGEHRGALLEGLEDPIRDDHAAHRDVGRGQCLGHGDDVRLVAVALAAEVVAEPAPGADHLVGDQQDVVLVADLPDALEVALLRRDAAACVLQRLEDHGAHRLRPLEEDPLLDLVRGPERIAVLWPAIAVRVRNVNPAWCERLELAPKRRDAGGAESPKGGAVVRDLARDQLGLQGVSPGAVIAPRQLDRRLDGLGSAVGEEDPVQVARRQRRDPRRQLDRAGVGVAPDRDEVELLDLRRHRIAELAAAVTRVDAEERREAVEIAFAVVIPDVAPLTANDDGDLVVRAERAHLGEVHPEMALCLLLERICLSFGGLRGAARCHPLSSSLSSLTVQRYPQAARPYKRRCVKSALKDLYRLYKGGIHF